MDVFIEEETEEGDLIIASVNYEEPLVQLYVQTIEPVKGTYQFKVRLSTLTPDPYHYVVLIEECEEWNINVGESEEEQDAYMNVNSDKRTLTGIFKGSRSDALAVYESMTGDIEVCCRVELSKDFLQTRKRSYNRRCKNGEMNCHCAVVETLCKLGTKTPPPSPASIVVNEILL